MTITVYYAYTDYDDNSIWKFPCYKK